MAGGRVSGPAVLGKRFSSLRICGRFGCADYLLGDYAFVALLGGATWAAFKFVVDLL